MHGDTSLLHPIGANKAVFRTRKKDVMISRWPKSQPKYRLIKPEVNYKRRNVKGDTHTHTHTSKYAINPPSPLCDANAAKMLMQNKQPKKDPTQYGMQITQNSS